MLRSILFLIVGKLWVWSTHVKLHFVSSPVLDGFGQHMLICILCIRWHRRGWDAFLCIAGFTRGLVNTCWYTYCVHAGISCDWSTLVELHFVSPPAFGGFFHRRLRYLFYPRSHEMDFFYTSWYPFIVLAGMVGVGLHKLRYVLCQCLHCRGLCRHTFCVRARMGAV